MKKLKEAWDWICRDKHWLILPAIAVGFAVLTRVLSGLWRPPSRQGLDAPGGITPKAGAEREREIRTASEAERERILEHGEDKRRRIEDKWGPMVLLLCAAWLAQGCAHGVERPEAPAWPAGHPEPSMTLSEGCEWADEEHQIAQCPAALFRKALVDITDLEDSLALTCEDLVECRAVASIRESVAMERVRRAHAETESARQQQWIWGAVGVALGSVAVGLAVGLGQ